MRCGKNRRCRGATLTEVAVAALIVMISALGLVYMLGVQRASTVTAEHSAQAVAIAQGRGDAVLADLSRGASSPLLAALPRDFTLRCVTASGAPASPWTLSVSETSEAVTFGAQSGYRLKTTVQYLDDNADNLSPTDTDPYDALVLRVSIVPQTAGAANPYERVALHTLWYR